MTTHSVGATVYDRFHNWTAIVVKAERVTDPDDDWSYDSYVLRRAGNPPRGQFSMIDMGQEYAQDGGHVRSVPS